MGHTHSLAFHHVSKLGLVADVIGEGGFGRYRFADAVDVHSLVIPAQGLVADALGALTEHTGEPLEGLIGQLANGFDVLSVQPFGGLGADTPQLVHSQRRQEGFLIAGLDHHQTIGLVQVRADLGDSLTGANPHGNDQPGLLEDAAFQVQRDGQRLFARLHDIGDIKVGLVHREGFHQVGEVSKDAHDLARLLFVAAKSGGYDDALGAPVHGRAHGHGGMHAEFPCFIGRSGDHSPVLWSAADQYRLAHQVRVVQLLYSGVEGVQVGVDDMTQSPRPRKSGIQTFYPLSF